jgi:hypothetical protein
MAINGAGNVGSILDHAAAEELITRERTVNHATQTLAIDDGNSEDIQTTGSAACMINGVDISSLTGDAAMVIASNVQGTVWLTAQSYTLAALPCLRFNPETEKRYMCILDHTSANSNKPGSGANWRTYWRESTSTAISAVGAVIPSGGTYSRYYLVTADAAGQLDVWLAGPAFLDAAPVFQMPKIEPALFVPIGIILVAGPATTVIHTLGTTTLTTVGSYIQLTGKVIPPYEA